MESKEPQLAKYQKLVLYRRNARRALRQLQKSYNELIRAYGHCNESNILLRQKLNLERELRVIRETAK